MTSGEAGMGLREGAATLVAGNPFPLLYGHGRAF